MILIFLETPLASLTTAIEKKAVQPVVPDVDADPVSKVEKVTPDPIPTKQWVAFQALLSTEDALALKEFFNSRNIEFKAV